MTVQIYTPSAEAGAKRRAIVSCWLCGIHRHRQQMVPDGSSACADIRWYCEDAQVCTDRWTSSRSRLQAAGAA